LGHFGADENTSGDFGGGATDTDNDNA
jgi:hypothetical protein